MPLHAACTNLTAIIDHIILSLPCAGKEVLIPLTSSLYVPGKLASTAEVLVDVGTNFFVGKPVKDAQEIMSKKVTLLKGNTDGILKVVQTKRENLARIDEYIEELRSSQQ